MLVRLARGARSALLSREGFIYVPANSDGPLADAEEGKTISIPNSEPPWIVVYHDISSVIVAKWPGRLWRAKAIEPATADAQAKRGRPPRTEAKYTRATAVLIRTELPAWMLFGSSGEKIVPIIHAATNLTRERASALAASRSPGAGEAAARVWKRWLEHVKDARSPVGSARSVIHSEVFRRARSLEGSDATTDDGDDVWLIEPWSTAEDVLTDAALAQALSGFASEDDFALLTKGWASTAFG
jgi:hypothetical protein